jgi:peroxiredoxin
MCKSQLVELARQAAEFRARGIEVAAIVPEPVSALRAFAVRLGIPYPLLSDPDSRIIRRFGLVDARSPKLKPEDPDLPYAGNFLLDADGTVRARFFEEVVAIRRTAGSILVHQGAAGGPQQEVDLGHALLRTSASNVELRAGQRFTLALEIQMEPHHHMYASGGVYRPLRLVPDPEPLFEFQPPQLPPTRQLFFAPLKETVSVYEGRFRLLQDVTLIYSVLQRLRVEPELELPLTGRLEYQVCSDRVCYPPASTHVRWSFRVRRFIK